MACTLYRPVPCTGVPLYRWLLSDLCEEKNCPSTVKLAQEVSNNRDYVDKESMTAEDKERLMCIICMDEYKTAMLVHGAATSI